MERTTNTHEPPVGFSEWCLVEIMGHNRYAGRVTEQTLAGAAMLRVDLPATRSGPGFSKFFNPSSVYALTPISEEVARALAEQIGHAPISRYDLPDDFLGELRKRQRAGALPLHPIDREQDDEDDEDDDSPF